MSEGLLLTLLRHGETEGNLDRRWQGDTDPELTETGRYQVLQIAEKFRSQDYDLILHSGMQRSYESAMIISKELSIDDVIILTALRDRSLGGIENLTSEQIVRSFGFDMTNILSEKVDKVPGAETIDHLKSRVRMTETYLQSKYSGKRVLAVSHGGFIRMFFREFISDPHNIRFTNCSYFTVYIDNGKISLRELSVEHV
ncbi:MAG: histidine phosphatase family protein [Thermoplasmata archaeon]